MKAKYEHIAGSLGKFYDSAYDKMYKLAYPKFVSNSFKNCISLVVKLFRTNNIATYTTA